MGDSGRGCLNDNRCLAVEYAKEEKESWRIHYNGEGRRSTLENLTLRKLAVLAEFVV